MRWERRQAHLPLSVCGWLCTRCRRCCYYCSLCTASVALLLTVTSCLRLNTWLLSQAGLTYGDEVAADIPFETQGKLHFEADAKRPDTLAKVRQLPHSLPSSHPPPLPSTHSPITNCTRHATDSILFFIRLPKCASTSFVDLLRKLSKIKDFYFEFNPSGAYNWKEDEKQSVAKQCTRKLLLDRNLIYARHFYFVNFAEYGLKRFSYVTMIRDPVDRVVSSYLYYHFSSKKHIQGILDPKHRNETLSECIRQQHEGCVHNLVTKYFCGHEFWCKDGDKRALDSAKDNLLGYFAVVGIVEEMSLSLRLMRSVLPQYFRTEREDDLTISALNKNERTARLSESEREEISAANSADVELYDFAVQRLHDQASQCGLYF